MNKPDDFHKKGGMARAAALTPSRRQEIARKAAEERWKRPVKPKPKGISRDVARLERLMAEIASTLRSIEGKLELIGLGDS